MSYINTNILKSRGLSLHEFSLLCVIKQQKFENNLETLESELNADVLSKFESLGLVEYVSRKTKSQKPLELIRTSKKGNEWIEDVNTAEVTEDILVLYNWIKNIYLSKGKSLGNQKKSKMMLAQFSKESGIIKNHLACLMNHFVNSEEDQEYSHILQNVFFKGESVFNVKFDLSSSRLYQFYQKQQNFFDDEFSKIKNG